MTSLESGYRSVIGSIHDVDDRRHMVAVSIPHEQIDHHGTSWGEHCWRDSFDRHLPEMLREHDRRQQIGRAVKAESLGHESRIIGQFDDFSGNRHAEAAFHDIKDGRLRGWSWYFTHGVAEPHPSVPGARRYKSATMNEFSAVRRPSLPSAHTTGLRSLDEGVRNRSPRGLVAEMATFELNREIARVMRQAETSHLAETLRSRFGITQRDIDTAVMAADLRERFGLSTSGRTA